jgi:hypothetical protein
MSNKNDVAGIPTFRVVIDTSDCPASKNIGGRKAIIQTYKENSGYFPTGYTAAYVSGDKFFVVFNMPRDLRNLESYGTTFDQIVKSMSVEY